MKKPISSSPGRTRGFTLVEIMVSVTLVGFVVMGTISLLAQTLRTYYYDSARIRINRDIRTFTQDMDTDAAYSNYFLIFPNFSSRTQNSGANDYILADGESGDFLLLVSTTTDVTTGTSYITKFIGYYRDATGTAAGPVRKFTVAIPNVNPSTLGSAPIASLLNTYMPTANQSTNPIVIQLADGLAVGVDPVSGATTNGLFYDFFDHSAMVRGQIIESSSGNPNDTSGNRRAVNTYNFTVSPRG
jgi:prepilin-type N-terminal cleavage/methylation domain-containing protein